jgi:hypothetical protein
VLLDDLPSEDEEAIVFAYIAWGTFESEPPDGGTASLDERAGKAEVWSVGDRVENGPNTTIYVVGEENASAFEGGFASCTQD